MEFSINPSFEKRKNADVLVLPFWQAKASVYSAWPLAKELQEMTKAPLDTKDFKGKEGETCWIFPAKMPEKRILLVGLGPVDGLSTERLRRSFSSVAKLCQSKECKDAHVCVPSVPNMTEEEVVQGVCEGLLLANYAFLKNKSPSKENQAPLLEKVCFFGLKPPSLHQANRCKAIAQGVYLARDLVNENADVVTPQYLANLAQEMGKKNSALKATILSKKQIEKEKMGLLLAVGRGSSVDPAFIILEYRGNPKSKEKTVIIGKGVTYDTGGLNLKPTGSMETMRSDMAGAATALAAVMVAAQLALKTNVVAVVPATENAIDGRSYKPGDIYVSHSGKTVEIDNTDAEGRLILADALSYAQKHLHPTRVIDLATLTGAMVIALGDEAAGFMSNHDGLAAALMQAGRQTHERVWRFPLYEEYKEQLRSDFADIKNSGGRPAGSITAAIFLQEFIAGTPWAHLDIAGTAYLSKEKRYLPKNGTGFGVRLLIEFLQQLKA